MRRQHDALLCFRRLPGIFDEFRLFLAAHPMRNLRRFEVNLESEFSHLRRNVLRRSLRLRRTGGTRSDVLRQVRELLPRIVTAKRRVAHRLQLLQQFFGEGAGAPVGGVCAQAEIAG